MLVTMFSLNTIDLVRSDINLHNGALEAQPPEHLHAESQASNLLVIDSNPDLEHHQWYAEHQALAAGSRKFTPDAGEKFLIDAREQLVADYKFAAAIDSGATGHFLYQTFMFVKTPYQLDTNLLPTLYRWHPTRFTRHRRLPYNQTNGRNPNATWCRFTPKLA